MLKTIITTPHFQYWKGKPYELVEIPTFILEPLKRTLLFRTKKAWRWQPFCFHCASKWAL